MTKQNENPQQQIKSKLQTKSMSPSDNNNNNNGVTATDCTNAAGSVQVYLRMRPLIAEEEGNELIQYEIKSNNQFSLKQASEDTAAPINPAFAGAPPLRSRRGGKDAWKVFGGFTKILKDDCNNYQAYQETVAPLVEQLAASPNNQSACVFTYGHTGSGKSHTLLGYGSELGVYKFAAKDLLEKLQQQQQQDDSGNNNKCLLVRVTELYKDTVMDLVSQPNQQCSIRQDGNGIVRIRGPMIESDEDGKIDQQPLGKLCQTYADVLDCVETAVKSRRVGISTHHSQSSRSHLVLELEIVTPELVTQRNWLLKQETHLTRLKWLQTERMFGKHHKNKVMPKWVEVYTTNTPSTLRKEILQYEKLVQESQQEYKKMSKNLEGTLVFVDLAGNEYARDAGGSTKEEMEQAAEINKSLLAVKEMIRSLSTKHKYHQNSRTAHQKKQQKHQQHVPYRDSKLTMMLRRHLDTSAIMLAHISPSVESRKKTLNTLNYSFMVSTCNNSVGKQQQ